MGLGMAEAMLWSVVLVGAVLIVMLYVLVLGVWVFGKDGRHVAQAPERYEGRHVGAWAE
jgi:hypothetical protein